MSGPPVLLEEDVEKDVETAVVKRFKTTCCHSYLTAKGRCYTCPDDVEVTQTEVDGEKFC